MTGHNLNLPRHLFGYVTASTVMRGSTAGALECVWFGLSVTGGRGIGCHLMLENGAIVVDVPLGAVWMPAEEPATILPRWSRADSTESREWWDSPGENAELVRFEYLDGLASRMIYLDETRRTVPQIGDESGRYLFSLDYIGDGYSSHPPQHKVFHAVAGADGTVCLVPNDRLLWYDAAFTSPLRVPAVRRQTSIRRVEPDWPAIRAETSPEDRLGEAMSDLEIPPHGLVDNETIPHKKNPRA